MCDGWIAVYSHRHPPLTSIIVSMNCNENHCSSTYSHAFDGLGGDERLIFVESMFAAKIIIIFKFESSLRLFILRFASLWRFDNNRFCTGYCEKKRERKCCHSGRFEDKFVENACILQIFRIFVYLCCFGAFCICMPGACVRVFILAYICMWFL